MTMGEGGAVYTDDPLLHKLVNSFRDWGRDCWCIGGVDNTCKYRFSKQFGDLPVGYDHKYVYSHFGYNLKVTDMQAAIGCAQREAGLHCRSPAVELRLPERRPCGYIWPYPSRSAEELRPELVRLPYFGEGRCGLHP